MSESERSNIPSIPLQSVDALQDEKPDLQLDRLVTLADMSYITEQQVHLRNPENFPPDQVFGDQEVLDAVGYVFDRYYADDIIGYALSRDDLYEDATKEQNRRRDRRIELNNKLKKGDSPIEKVLQYVEVDPDRHGADNIVPALLLRFRTPKAATALTEFLQRASGN